MKQKYYNQLELLVDIHKECYDLKDKEENYNRLYYLNLIKIVGLCRIYKEEFGYVPVINYKK